ncbi:MAG TPA: hypothetical protein VND65_00995 [Candidatus Binatia bacterium]|nr:hypothetical protein [Candidatus Binatia bacterium]
MIKQLALLTCCAVLSVAAFAQNGPTCTVTVDNTQANCSATEWLPNLTACEHAKVQCGTFSGVTIADIGITFGYKNPSGTSSGTVLFFSDGGGETTPDGDVVGTSKVYAAYYNGSPNNYQVVQTAWDSDWEDTGSGNTKQIAYAAGRPAAFIKWVYNNLFGSVTQSSKAGMCLQGASAGGAAEMYALTWYGQYSFVDKVSLLSAPPLSDVARGCYHNPLVLLSPVSVCPSGQLGCNSTNSPASWSQDANYSGSALTSVQTWGGDSNCGGPNTTTQSELSSWKKMSIVDGNVATFNYPQTAITTWLCSSVAAGDGSMNNSSPEAQLFFQQFTSPSQYDSLLINGVGNCASSEEVGPGTPPQNYVNMGYTTGQEAIEYDMTTDPANKCTLNHSN